MPQQQQQRRLFTAALLALVFILAAVSTTEAGKKEKPGKVQLTHPWATLDVWKNVICFLFCCEIQSIH